jgi:2-keto-4-pentenoate hydratase
VNAEGAAWSSRRAREIAARFVDARQRAQALADFPGAIASDLAQAYAVQDAAIAQWPDRLIGWKVGYIAPERRDARGEDRLVGPMWAQRMWRDTYAREIDVPIIVGGFAAVEAEFVFRLGVDAAPAQTQWRDDQALALVEALHIGVEVAGSPLATINELGPAVVVSDFGNHAGLILGPEIPHWRAQRQDDLRCRTKLDGTLCGDGGAHHIPGGLARALAFALGRCAQRGLPLRAGMLVSTGAATGIHDIRVGQRAEVEFGAYGTLRCRAVAARARTPA